MANTIPVLDYANDRDIATQPDDSNIVINETAEGVSYVVPPTGVYKVGGELTVIIIGVLVILTLVSIACSSSEFNLPQFVITWFFIVVITGGIAVWIREYRIKATRPTILSISRNRITVTKPRFRLKLSSSGWDSREIKQFRVFGNDFNLGKRQGHLQLILVKGRAIELLTDRDWNELTWLAVQLRLRLGLSDVA